MLVVVGSDGSVREEEEEEEEEDGERKGQAGYEQDCYDKATAKPRLLTRLPQTRMQ